MTTTTAAYEANPVRGPFNAAFFTVTGGYLDWLMRSRKQRVFADLPDEIVELGSGVGANFRYLRPGTRVIAVEPNPAMHARLRARAARHEIEMELRDVVGEQLDLPDASTDMVMSSLVLCTVSDPAQVLAEVRRVLRPGGHYAFVEHVGAKDRPVLRRIQRLVRRPWAWVFEGCSCERDVAEVIASAGFASVDVEAYRIHSPVLPFNTHVAGIATKGRDGVVAAGRPGMGCAGARLDLPRGSNPSDQLPYPGRGGVRAAQDPSRGCGGRSPSQASAVGPAAEWHIRAQIRSLARRLAGVRSEQEAAPATLSLGIGGGQRALLRDGSEVLIRPIQSADAPLLADGFARLSAKSRQMRFLTAKKELSAAELRYFTDVDHHDHEALGALNYADGRGVGIVRYIRSAEDPQAAEIAVTVVDEWQGRGLGSELVAQLSDRARHQGIRRFTALVAADNVAVAGLLRTAEAELVRRESTTFEYEITLVPRKNPDHASCRAGECSLEATR